jgi:hypothetical protein
MALLRACSAYTVPIARTSPLPAHPTGMKSTVQVDIDAPQQKVAALFADPSHSAEWMEDLELYEPIDGEPGMPGSIYRLVQRHGESFLGTVVSRDLPREQQLYLDAPKLAVSIKSRFSELSPGRTRLTSEEDFDFKGGLLARLNGLLSRGAIQRAHQRQMQAFRRYAERS